MIFILKLDITERLENMTDLNLSSLSDEEIMYKYATTFGLVRLLIDSGNSQGVECNLLYSISKKYKKELEKRGFDLSAEL
jgi:hypothetical protein